LRAQQRAVFRPRAMPCLIDVMPLPDAAAVLRHAQHAEMLRMALMPMLF